MNKSYGGYLPLELRQGKDYFCSLPAMRFNCANAAIDHILDLIDVKSVYLPYYMCPNICENLNNKDINVIYYHVGDDLLPVDEFSDKNACIYITDYFGIMGNTIDDLISKYSGNYIIADFCHAFYHQPVIEDKVFCIYSARKFFGVPDGAYLVNKNLTSDYSDTDVSYSSEFSSYLLTSLEHGTNYAYKDKKEADSIIKLNKGKMSYLARRILNSIDYEAVKTIRKQNAAKYDDAFSSINLIHIEKNSSPYMYPLNIGKDIRSQLVKENVFTPTLWGQLLSEEFNNTKERELTTNTVFLPVDQRYDETDIDTVIGIVRRFI